ncbi:MAG: tetratricopeptide repeat protein [Chloroflexota bacterium]
MVYREDDRSKMIKAKAREAVSLAMDCRWEDAALVNREIIAADPANLEACNRLGKALLETGDNDGAIAAFGRALELDPTSTIARKNLERLRALSAAGACSAPSSRPVLTPHLFISDSGRSTQVSLAASPVGTERTCIAPGTAVSLERRGDTLAVRDEGGVYLGLVPPKLGRRLICLMDGGNRYGGAVSSVSDEAVKVILRETYQHPSQRAKVSFPALSSEEPALALPEREEPTVTEDDEAVEGLLDWDGEFEDLATAEVKVGAGSLDEMPDEDEED